MKRGRAWRRTQNKRVQRNRHLQWIMLDWDLNNPGRLRKTHFGCGCGMCKPWKHGWGMDKYDKVKYGRKKFVVR